MNHTKEYMTLHQLMTEIRDKTNQLEALLNEPPLIRNSLNDLFK